MPLSGEKGRRRRRPSWGHSQGHFIQASILAFSGHSDTDTARNRVPLCPQQESIFE